MSRIIVPVRQLSVAKLVLSVLSFAITMAWAYVSGWEAVDIIWSLWISSLCVGYLFLVVALGVGLYRNAGPLSVSKLAFAGFLLAFFTLHFGFFHLVHGLFLQDFFPLGDEKGALFFLPATLQAYWVVVLTSLASRLSDFSFAGVDFSGETDLGLVLFKPYLNVLRMHVLIFVFAILAIAQLDRLALYPVLLLYFFPWGSLFKIDLSQLE